MREVEGSDIRLSLEALDASASEMVVGYPGAGALAAQWNEAARRNNRVEIDLSPDLALARN